MSGLLLIAKSMISCDVN